MDIGGAAIHDPEGHSYQRLVPLDWKRTRDYPAIIGDLSGLNPIAHMGEESRPGQQEKRQGPTIEALSKRGRRKRRVLPSLIN